MSDEDAMWSSSKSISGWIATVHGLAVEKGWWSDAKTGEPVEAKARIPEAIALIHSEVSEALEEYRHDRLDVFVTAAGKPEGLPVELADTVIRIFDLCGALGIDLEEAMRVKHEYNKTRPYRHGGKKA